MDILGREVARAIERTRAEIARRDSEELLAFALKVLPIGLALIDADGRMLMASDEMRKYVPKGVVPSRDLERRNRWKAWGPDGAPLEFDQFPGARVLRGETVIPGVEMLYTQDDGSEVWARVAAIPMRNDAGELVGAATACVDIDALKRAEARQATLLHELQHRVRNILALVRSLARRTAETGESVEDVAELLDGRIGALARTQVLLTSAADAGVDLAVLVHEELLAQAADDLELKVVGPPVMLAPKAAETLALAIHELATNASKYGAIAQGGALSVSWTIETSSDGPDWLRLDWIESRMKASFGEPRRRGFGTELIERLVPYELQGRGRMELSPDGLIAEISLPLITGQSILAGGEP
jgi:PAS domain S-box-containing protein